MIVFRDAWTYLTTGASWRGQDGLVHLGLQQLLITITALAIALAIGLPLALWLGHIGRFGFLAINVSNVGRAVPTFALLGLFVTLDPWTKGGYFPGVHELGPYGRAGTSTLVALALFALPPIITNAYVAVREVDEQVVHAATGVGMSGWQRFWRVELPLARPLVFSGVRLALVQVWATATIAALVAGPGVGNVITNGFTDNKYGQGVGGGIFVAVVALVLEMLCAGAQWLLDPLGSTRRRRPRGGSSPDRDVAGEAALSADGPTVTAPDTGTAGDLSRS